MYPIIRRILFFLSPEAAHYLSMSGLSFLCSIPFIRIYISKICTPTSNKTYSLFNLQFKNRIGLGAGFDKNAKYLRELEALGFGFVEIGTVTPRPQPGNEKPRVFRLIKDRALINRMGFNNDGVEVIKERLKKWREQQQHRSLTKHHSPLIIGGNIGKNKVTPNEEAWKDYEICFLELHPYVDFFVVNVSSPNTPGLRELQEKDSLRKILTHLQELNRTFEIQRPILLKIAPDLTWEQINDVVDLAKEINLDGIVATNTTISREGLIESKESVTSMGAGGLSGRPLTARATEVIQYLHNKTNGAIPIIGSGGIFTAADAKEKFKAGASLIEIWTGFIYEGPFIVKKISQQLVK